MSHSVVVNLIADQTLFIRGREINIHDLESITLDAGGCIIAFRLKALDSDKGTIHKEFDFEYTHKTKMNRGFGLCDHRMPRGKCPNPYCENARHDHIDKCEPD